MSARLRMVNGLRSLSRLPVAAACRVREQADRQEWRRLDAGFATLDGARPGSSTELMWRGWLRDASQTDPDDPPELLWKLPARRP